MKKNRRKVRRKGKAQGGRAGLTALLRNRTVQLLLGGVAVAQLASGGNLDRSESGAPTLVLNATMAAAPQESQVRKLWREKATARASQRLAQRYIRQGYEVPADLANEIHKTALQFDIDPAIAFGLVRAESSFRNSATSYVGAVGLTQLMPKTAAWMEPGTTRRDLRDPETNLRIGFKYLRYLLDKYDGDQRLALLAYNRGPGTVDRVLSRGGDPDNGYVEKVLGE